MRSLGWTPIQSAWYPYKKRLGHRDTEGRHMRMQGEDRGLQDKERGLEGTIPADTLILTSSLQNCERINVCCLSTTPTPTPDLWHSVMAVQAHEDTLLSKRFFKCIHPQQSLWDWKLPTRAVSSCIVEPAQSRLSRHKPLSHSKKSRNASEIFRPMDRGSWVLWVPDVCAKAK